MKKAIDPVIKWEQLFKKCTSVVTDGENMNTGAHNGLWALCQKERDASGTNLPLLKIWCAAHRTNLAWKSVCNSVPEVGNLVQTAADLCTFFPLFCGKNKRDS